MTNTFRNLPAILGSLAVIVIVFGFTARDASARTDQWHWPNPIQYIYNGAAWAVGPAHSITDNTAYVDGTVCVGAIDVNGGGLSGAGICGITGYVSHPYNGLILRDPAVYPPNQTSVGIVADAYETY